MVSVAKRTRRNSSWWSSRSDKSSWLSSARKKIQETSTGSRIGACFGVKQARDSGI